MDNLGCQGLSCRSLRVSFRCRDLGPQDFENHPTLVVIDQCKYMRAAFAQPVVLDMVDSAWRLGCRITLTRQRRIRPKSEKLAASGPVKGSRTRRVRALGMLLLIERRSCQRFSGWCLFFARGALCSLALMFKALNGSPQPVPKNLFDLALFAVPIQGVQRFTRFIEWNVAAGDFCRTEFRWH